MALITPDDLAAAMGRASRPFSPDEEGQAQVIIDATEAFIMAECQGIAFEVNTVVNEKMQADYFGIIEIRSFPIINITSVVDARSGEETWWDWDDFDTVFDLDPFQTVLVDYSYGYTTPPIDLVIAAKSMASRTMSNPLGIRQQTVGAISETYAAGGLNAMEQRIIDKYKPFASSLRLGPQTGRRKRQLPTL